ncbi:MAG: hypothetical protein JWQ40_3475 [Segetibacter sp.]|nr:hypothetical protein [Segetibacter sp.]
MHTGINQGSKGETIRQLAHRHLRDQNHTTTDEELKNALLEFSPYAYSAEENRYQPTNTTTSSIATETK